MKKPTTQIVGIIPAAGQATRLGQLPISKELYPIGYENGKVKVVANQLMDSMADSGASQIHFVIRNGKWDIPAFFESKYKKTTAVCYHLIEYGYGVPFTINQALPFVMDKTVVFGFPDILFQPDNAFGSLLETLEQSDAPIVLGCFPVPFKAKFDRAVIGPDHNVLEIQLKPEKGSAHFAWIMAAWKPAFSEFLHQFVENELLIKTPEQLTYPEIQISEIINTAIQGGMKIKAIQFEGGKCIDIGKPDEMEKRLSFNF